MKTYFKGFKTVAVIFLSLVLFSCQDEVIVPQDTLSTAPDQDMLKPGKGNGGGGDGGTVYFNVEVVNPLSEEVGNHVILTDLIVDPVGCVATNNSKQTAVWFDEGCDNPFTTTDGTNLSLSFVSMGKSPIDEIQVWMRDANGNQYKTKWEDGSIDEPATIDPEGYTVVFNDFLTIYKKEGKGKNRQLIESGEIFLGEINMVPK